jgi:HK97 family phage major capsid protein
MAAATRSLKHVREDLSKNNAEKATLMAEQRKLLGAARDAGRGLTAEEEAAAKATKSRLDVLAMDRDLLESELEGLASAADIERASAAVSSGVKSGWESDPARGFKTSTEFLGSVISAHRGQVDPRIRSLWHSNKTPVAAAGSDEAVVSNDPYGGFLVPKTMLMPGVKMLGSDVNPFSALTTKVDMGGHEELKINARVDKDHSTSVSGGLVVYRRVETQTVTAKRIQFEQVTLRVNELMGLSYASEELLRKSPVAFASLLSQGFGQEFGAKLLSEFLDGDGVGRYEGIWKSGAKIEVSKETGQAADTIVYSNLVKMMARCWNYGAAYWYANPTCIPSLATMTMPGGLAPVYQMANGITTILGRPAFFGEFAKPIGDAGDITLVVPSEYLESEDEPIQNASSIHVRFVEHEQAFKFWTSNGGACWWRTALTPKNGDTLSPIVTLAARA